MEIRTRYFNIAEPFEITAEEFAVHWSQVDNIWSLLRVSESEHGNPWKAYSCRLFKRSQSSTRKDGVSDKKTPKDQDAHRTTVLCSNQNLLPCGPHGSR